VRTQNRVFGGLLMAVGAGLFFVKQGGAHAWGGVASVLKTLSA
jgi:hypothetical protein